MIHTISLAGSKERNFDDLILDKDTDLFLFDTLLSDKIPHIKIREENTEEMFLKLILVSLRENKSVLIVNDYTLTKDKLSAEIGKKRFILCNQFIFLTHFLKKELLKILNHPLKTDLVSYQKTKTILETYLQ